jgi:hypothetical protein
LKSVAIPQKSISNWVNWQHLLPFSVAIQWKGVAIPWKSIVILLKSVFILLKRVDILLKRVDILLKSISNWVNWQHLLPFSVAIQW